MEEVKKIKENESLKPSFTNLSESVKVWWKNLKIIINIYLWGVFYALIPLLIVAVFFFILGKTSIAEVNNVVGITLISVAVIIAAYFLTKAYIALFLLVKNDYKGDAKELYKEANKHFWPYLGLTILSTFIILLWSLLLVIPGIIFSVLYSLAVYVLFFENKRGMAALKRSRELVRGYFWPVLWRNIVVGVAISVFMMIVSIPASGLPETHPFFIIWNAITQVIAFLVGPIALIFSYDIYKNLVLIKEKNKKDA